MGGVEWGVCVGGGATFLLQVECLPTVRFPPCQAVCGYLKLAVALHAKKVARGVVNNIFHHFENFRISRKRVIRKNCVQCMRRLNRTEVPREPKDMFPN